MEKEIDLFDKKFVHFMWDEKLKGKKVFLSNYITELQFYVEQDDESNSYSVVYSGNESAPFQSTNGVIAYQFAYYDPNYEVKLAYYKEGKKVQVGDYIGNWSDCHGEPHWSDNCKYRIKPEEEKWIVYLARPRFVDNCYLPACLEDKWGSIQKGYIAKRKLFVGTESEVTEWYHSRKKFTEVIKAWEDGKQIQIKNGRSNWFNIKEPDWEVNCEYRVKPECPCEDGIDSKACAGCPQDEARKQTFRPFKDCDELIDFWIKHYQSTHKPMYTRPLVWVRLKVDKRERLIVSFGKGFGTDFVEIGNKAKAVPLQKLFDDYEFLDGKPCGVEY